MTGAAPLDPNPAHAQRTWPSAVVASAFQTGVLLARNLERRGVRVTLVDSDPTVHGFRSVYGKTLLCPNPDTAPAAWVDFMLGLARRSGEKPALLAAADMYVSAIGRNAAALREGFVVSRSAEVQADLALKEGQVRLAGQHGLPIPRTRYAETEADVERFAAEARFPCLFKPQQQRFWDSSPMGHPLHNVKVMISTSPAQLLEQYRMAAKIAPAVVLQEVIEGPDSNKRIFVGVYRESGGERLGCCTTRMLRCLPMMYGVGTVVEPVADPEVVEICDGFLRRAGYTGICELELKRDSRDGRVKMMDINPRYTGSGDAAPYAGLDHGWLHYLDLIGQPVQPVRLNGKDFRHFTFRNDMVAIRDYRRAGLLTWRQVRETYRGPRYYWDLDFRDWRLAASTLYQAARVWAGAVWRMAVPK